MAVMNSTRLLKMQSQIKQYAQELRELGFPVDEKKVNKLLSHTLSGTNLQQDRAKWKWVLHYSNKKNMTGLIKSRYKSKGAKEEKWGTGPIKTSKTTVKTTTQKQKQQKKKPYLQPQVKQYRNAYNAAMHIVDEWKRDPFTGKASKRAIKEVGDLALHNFMKSLSHQEDSNFVNIMGAWLLRHSRSEALELIKKIEAAGIDLDFLYGLYELDDMTEEREKIVAIAFEKDHPEWAKTEKTVNKWGDEWTRTAHLDLRSIEQWSYDELSYWRVDPAEDVLSYDDRVTPAERQFFRTVRRRYRVPWNFKYKTPGSVESEIKGLMHSEKG